MDGGEQSHPYTMSRITLVYWSVGALVVAALAFVAFYYWMSGQQEAGGFELDESVGVVNAVGSVTVNPGEKIPKTNPFENKRTNPFEEAEYKNPFAR